MNIDDIMAEIDAEIGRLQQAKALLGDSASSASTPVKRKPGRPPMSSLAGSSTVKPKLKRRTISAEGRARIAAAQKARWAKSKKAAGVAGKKKAGRPAKSAGKKASTASRKTAAKVETAAVPA